MNIVDQYREQLQENRPITYKDLELYPLTVRHFALYQSAKPAFELMQGTLPPALARLSWFNCLAELDKKAREEGKNADFLGSVLRVLAAALRLAKKLGKGKTVVTVLPDTAERYFSTLLFE